MISVNKNHKKILMSMQGCVSQQKRLTKAKSIIGFMWTDRLHSENTSRGNLCLSGQLLHRQVQPNFEGICRGNV